MDDEPRAGGSEPGFVARLGVACMAAALLTGVGAGVWELARPILTDQAALDAAPRLQLWAYGVMQLVKSAGFLAGLYGFYFRATRRGRVVTFFLGLAVAGAAFFSAVWLWIAASSHFTIIYVLGGMWYQMIAPVVLGVAALLAHRVARWKAALVAVVGLMNMFIFGRFGVARASIIQGVIWLALGYVVYSCGRARASV
ncbi:MAG: hypothetical protein LC746_11965 [Acidobacteria bacterium]|nr:hypothetical protein [Acidobacteriota bacterium]